MKNSKMMKITVASIVLGLTVSPALAQTKFEQPVLK